MSKSGKNISPSGKRANSARREAAGLSTGDAGLDLLWGIGAAPARGPKPSLEVAGIARAGVRLADRDGLASVTIQSLARELGVSPMALYRYAPNKDVLIALAADFAMSAAPEPAGGDWRANVLAWAKANLAMLQRHPWLMDVGNSHTWVGPNWARWLETGLEALQVLPFSLDERMAVLVALDGHVRAAGQLLAGAKATAAWNRNFERMLTIVAADARYPALSALGGSGGSGEEGFDLPAMLDFGLERLLDGVAALALARTRASSSRT